MNVTGLNIVLLLGLTGALPAAEATRTYENTLTPLPNPKPLLADNPE
ncbi:MAG TPA: hypothetical protein VLT36_19710 [Candidatus Dormibacteraeota bacterium]|nr:hypothetical protein [Candidatus Dormibacteraeota bacterium]